MISWLALLMATMSAPVIDQRPPIFGGVIQNHRYVVEILAPRPSVINSQSENEFLFAANDNFKFFERKAACVYSLGTRIVRRHEAIFTALFKRHGEVPERFRMKGFAKRNLDICSRGHAKVFYAEFQNRIAGKWLFVGLCCFGNRDIGPKLTLGGILSDFVLFLHRQGGSAGVFHRFERGVQSSLDENQGGQSGWELKRGYYQEPESPLAHAPLGFKVFLIAAAFDVGLLNFTLARCRGITISTFCAHFFSGVFGIGLSGLLLFYTITGG